MLDKNESSINEEDFGLQRKFMENRLTQKTMYVHDSLILMPESLAKSKSLPILRNEVSNNVTAGFVAADTLMSKSSFARNKKMSMIVERMAPLISSCSLTISDLLSSSKTNCCDQQYKARRFESRTMLPVLYVRFWMRANELREMSFQSRTLDFSAEQVVAWEHTSTSRSFNLFSFYYV